MPAPTNVVKLLDTTTISASGVGDVVVGLHRYQGIFGQMAVTVVPTGGSPTLDVYLQGSPDGGTTWRDLCAFQFTGSQAVRQFQLSQLASGGTSNIAASDAALASGTQIQGPFGDRLRVKYVFAAGGSSGSYTLAVNGVPVGGP